MSKHWCKATDFTALRFESNDTQDVTMEADNTAYNNDQHTQERTNFNISAYRVLYILALLVQHQSLGMNELNRYLQENPYIQRSYNSETITKYVNTLRKVGCKIPKTTSKLHYRYVLQENPFHLTLDQTELEAILAILTLLEKYPDEGLQRRYVSFLHQVAWLLAPNEKQRLLKALTDSQTTSTTQTRRALLERYRKLCKDSLVLEIYYQPDAFTQTSILIEPIRILQERHHLYLLGKEKNTKKQMKLNLGNILDVVQRPDKAPMSGHSIQVVFQLYDRLAKTYRPYPDENIIFAKDNIIQVRAKTDDLDMLLTRLLKYNTLCQVISPMTARKQIRQRIETLIQTSRR